MNPYETAPLVSQYLLFHYGEPEEVLPWPDGPRDALGFPERCARLLAGHVPENRRGRALDLGCAVGRSTFELARSFREVVGIDYSRSFVDAARLLARTGSHPAVRIEEGARGTPWTARVPEGIDRSRCRFEQGDACEEGGRWGEFDAVLLANLIDRVNDPAGCLARLASHVAPGGVVLITSPYTWMEEYTPQDRWLGGRPGDGSVVDRLLDLLQPVFTMVEMREMPFLIREHARKYQWSVAQATVWRRS
jgi:putative 4-mercaptohistidine N1-methyltranferase